MSKKKIKVLGPSNDKIPDDEIVLAKLLQTANAYGLRGCRGDYFKTATGFRLGAADVDVGSPPKRAVYCCAVGASLVDPDTNPLIGWGVGLVTCGNDDPDDGGLDREGSGYTIGAAFNHAMRGVE